MRAMTRPVNLEFDLDGAARGERDSHVERWLTRLTGAEAATVVNNNAAAVYLALNTLALQQGSDRLARRADRDRRRVPHSRHHGALRLQAARSRHHQPHAPQGLCGGDRPAHRRDHESAHQQLRDPGLHRSVPEAELARLAHEHELPFIVDLGSGMLVDLEDYGLPHEPTPREALAHGADVVTFSGDKLLGGPQAGSIVGRKDLDRAHQARTR